MLAQQKIAFAKNAAMIGREISVLVDSVNPKKKTATARHPGQAPDIDGRVLLIKTSALPGELLTACIEETDGYDLIARPAPSGKRTPAPAILKSRLSLPVIAAIPASVESRSKSAR